MLSRVADSVFWMSRYIERAENVARFIDVNHNLTLEFGDSLEQPWWPLDWRPKSRRSKHVGRPWCGAASFWRRAAWSIGRMGRWQSAIAGGIPCTRR